MSSPPVDPAFAKEGRTGKVRMRGLTKAALRSTSRLVLASPCSIASPLVTIVCRDRTYSHRRRSHPTRLSGKTRMRGGENPENGPHDRTGWRAGATRRPRRTEPQQPGRGRCWQWVPGVRGEGIGSRVARANPLPPNHCFSRVVSAHFSGWLQRPRHIRVITQLAQGSLSKNR